MSDPLERYSRQMILPDWGRAGQERLSRQTAVVVGCGALGSAGTASLRRLWCRGLGGLGPVERSRGRLPG